MLQRLASLKMPAAVCRYKAVLDCPRRYHANGAADARVGSWFARTFAPESQDASVSRACTKAPSRCPKDFARWLRPRLQAPVSLPVAALRPRSGYGTPSRANPKRGEARFTSKHQEPNAVKPQVIGSMPVFLCILLPGVQGLFCLDGLCTRDASIPAGLLCSRCRRHFGSSQLLVFKFLGGPKP